MHKFYYRVHRRRRLIGPVAFALLVIWWCFLAPSSDLPLPEYLENADESGNRAGKQQQQRRGDFVQAPEEKPVKLGPVDEPEPVDLDVFDPKLPGKAPKYVPKRDPKLPRINIHNYQMPEPCRTCPGENGTAVYLSVLHTHMISLYLFC